MTIEDRRVKLHDTLKYYLGSKEVYYDPPETITMSYPAIVYTLSNIGANYADNKRYMNMTSYSVTLIRKDDDDDILDRILAEVENVRYDRPFIANGLHHDVFTVFI